MKLNPHALVPSRISSKGHVLAPIAIALAVSLCATRTTALPENFVHVLVTDDLQTPTDIAIAPDGRMMVAEKRGVVYMIENNVRAAEPFIDLINEVHNAGDRGLLGIEFDPNFATNGYVYLLYAVDPIWGQPDEDAQAATFGRLVRYTMGTDGKADLDSRKILLGETARDGFPIGAVTHSTGTVKFGLDGTLFVSAGDGASASFVDSGQNVTEFDDDFDAMFPESEDIGALRSQSLSSLAGKILRIDPETGLGVESNPYHNGNGDLNRARVWSSGLRNPFRFTVRPNSPGPGTLFIGDVGWNRWEEVNVAVGKDNFGWPCYEGAPASQLYQINELTAPTCDGLSLSDVTPPLIQYHHQDEAEAGFMGKCIGPMTFYSHTRYPARYWGSYFFADFASGWLKVAFVDPDNNLLSIEDFEPTLPSPVDMEVDPVTGDIVYVSISMNAIFRIHYTENNQPPTVVASGEPPAGAVPFDVQFSSDGTFDPDGDSFTLDWNFGDGSAHSAEANPIHTYTQTQIFDVTLTATDAMGNQSSAAIQIQADNQAPTVTLISPTDGFRLNGEAFVQLTAEADDAEQGEGLDYLWQVNLIHNEHTHPEVFTSTLAQPELPIRLPDHGDGENRFSYVVNITVTDAGGLTASDSARLLPKDLPLNQWPAPQLTLSATDGIAPLLISFDATGSFDQDDDQLSYHLSFGDGAESDDASTTHIYTAPGLYNVTLTVTDALGAVNTAETSVTVRGLGLQGEYFTDPELTDLVHQRSDGPIDFDWGTGRAFEDMRRDNFSVRWSGTVQPQYSELYTFFTITDDGVRLWVDGQLIIDHWEPQAAAVRSGSIDLQAGVEYAITMEYFELRGDAEAELSWSSPSRVIQIIPADRLTHGPATQAAPAVDVGPDLTVTARESISIAGAATDDDLPEPSRALTYRWSQRSGPYSANIEEPNSAATRVTFPEQGPYLLRLEVSDGQLTGHDEVMFNVGAAPNIAPLAYDYTASLQEDEAIGFILAAGDPDGNALTYELVSSPLFGPISGAIPTFTYAPHADFSGTDSIAFRAFDGQLWSDIATITFDVAPVNDPPMADDLYMEADESTPVLVRLTGSDVDGDFLSFVLTTPPTGGSISGESAMMTYTPADGFIGIDRFSFVAFDGLLQSAEATVEIDVRALPRLGFASAIVASEGDGQAEILINIGGGSREQIITVEAFTVAGSATPGLDYVEMVETITIDPADTTKTVMLPLLEDLLIEGTETLEIHLRNPTGALLDSGAAGATITITDNDFPNAVIVWDVYE